MQMKQCSYVLVLFQCMNILCCGNLEESNLSLNFRANNE